MHRTHDLTWGQVVALLHAGAAVIANVMHGEHFVLVVGVDDVLSGDTLYVNDPGFYRPSYSYTQDVVGWRLYAIAPADGHDRGSGRDAGAKQALAAQIEMIEATR